MARILLALIALQAAVLAQAPALESARSKLRPSLVAISKRVLAYAVEGDFKRANKAAEYLVPLSKELEKSGSIDKQHWLALEPALADKNLHGIREALRRLVLADIHNLLTHLHEKSEGRGPTPRTRLLMAQQNLKFLEGAIPKGERGDKMRLALDKLFQILIQTVPHKAEYGAAGESWVKKANQHSKKILLLLDSVILPPGSKETQKKKVEA